MRGMAQTQKKTPSPTVARSKCDVFGLDKICDLITAGDSMTAIAAQIGVHISTLIEWSEGDAQRSARMREARQRSARIWDERAEHVITLAGDPFELSKAKELAHHYRWRAKAIAPREYGDKVTQEHTGAGGGPIAIAAVDLKNLSDDELESMQRLMMKAGNPK
jgi:transposase